MYGYTRYYSHILSKNVHSLRSTLSHNHILSKIRPFSQKQIAVMWLFSIFLWKTPCCHAHWWSKKHQYWQNYTILWTVKSIRCSLFRLFMKKSPLQCSHFVTNLHSQKKICPQAYILSKKRQFFQKHCVPMWFFFFKLVMKKHPAVMPIFGQEKYRFCQNYTILWAKKVNRMAFFSDFSQKNNFCHAHIL